MKSWTELSRRHAGEDGGARFRARGTALATCMVVLLVLGSKILFAQVRMPVWNGAERGVFEWAKVRLV
jgi:hypothetical protein